MIEDFQVNVEFQDFLETKVTLDCQELDFQDPQGQKVNCIWQAVEVYLCIKMKCNDDSCKMQMQTDITDDNRLILIMSPRWDGF